MEFLFTSADKSQVTVEVNGALSKCSGDCSYEVIAAGTPVLNTATLAGNVLTLNVTTTSAVSAITVSIDGTKCNNNVGSNTESFTCTLESNSNGLPKIRAGSYVPTVDISGVGLAQPAPSFTNVSITLTASSVAGAASGLSGGVPITINGNGFPFSTAETPFSVTVCNKAAVVKTVSNSQIGIILPPCATTAATISIAFKGQTATLSYTYDDTIITPTVSSITPTSYSPVLKGSMNITGTNFGTVKGDLNVYLVNSTGHRVYQMNVLNVSDTQLTVKIPGGETAGTFTVVVNRAGFGDSAEATTDAAKFKYEIVITSITPSSGSPNGGTVLTIAGVNFCPLI